jgi:hypothetical protein
MKVVSILILILSSWTVLDSQFLIAENNDILKTYDAKLTKIKEDDVNAYYQLGLWCKDNNLPGQMNTLFLKIIKLNPEHKDARKELGYIKFEDEWIKQEEIVTYKEEQKKVRNLLNIIESPVSKKMQKETSKVELDKIEKKYKVKPFIDKLNQQ